MQAIKALFNRLRQSQEPVSTPATDTSVFTVIEELFNSLRQSQESVSTHATDTAVFTQVAADASIPMSKHALHDDIVPKVIHIEPRFTANGLYAYEDHGERHYKCGTPGCKIRRYADVKQHILRCHKQPCIDYQSDTMVWSPDGNRVCGIRTPEIRGTLGRIPVRALPDWGSAVNAVSEAFARRHNLEIDTTTSVCSIPLMGGNVAHSIGRVTGCFKFKGRGSSSHRCEFHVLRKSLHDVILGRAFLDETETLTLYSHRIVQVVRPCLRRGKRLFLLDNETPKAARIRCAVNGASASAFPDTGSDLMLVSGDFARRNGFKVHRGKKYRSRVELIDGSTILTDGMVLDAKLQFDVPPLPSLHEVDYDAYGSFLSGLSHLTGRGRRASSMMTFICDLHVVEDLPCDIILSHDFIFRNQVFSRFNSLFHSGRDETRQKDAASVDRCLMFVRSKSSKLSWFRRRRPRPPSETLDLPLRSSPSWDDLWELEVAQRNRMQLWIASLSEPQKSVEERNEAQRRALWDRENPRPPPTPAPSSDPSLRRIPVSRPSPAASQTGASSITAAVSAVSG